MKTHRHSTACFLASLFCLGLPPVALRGAETGANPAASADITHTLFLGSDIAIEWQGQFRPLVGVKGSAFVVNVDGKPTVIPAAESKVRIKVADQLRMSESVASVANVKTERTYSPGNDPGRRLVESTSMAMSGNEAQTLARRESRYAQTAGANPAPTNGSPGGAAAAQAEAEAARERASIAQSNYFQSAGAGSNFSDVGARSAIAGRESAEQRFDAIRVTFGIASDKPLAAPYLVVLANLRDDGKKSGPLRQLVYAQNLPPLDANQRTVEVYRGGLPPGYELEDCRIHLYDGGREVATSVSRKQVPLGRNDAFQFAVADYVSRHKNETLPPAPAREFWTDDLASRMAVNRAESTVHVKIGKSGQPEGAFEDRACTRRIADDVLARTISELRFYPALAKGVAVGGVAIMHVGQPAG